MMDPRFVDKSPLSDDGMASAAPGKDGMSGPGSCPECVDDGMGSKVLDTAGLNTDLAPPQCGLGPKVDGMEGPGGCPECVDDGMSPPHS